MINAPAGLFQLALTRILVWNNIEIFNLPYLKVNSVLYFRIIAGFVFFFLQIIIVCRKSWYVNITNYWQIKHLRMLEIAWLKRRNKG